MSYAVPRRRLELFKDAILGFLVKTNWKALNLYSKVSSEMALSLSNLNWNFVKYIKTLFTVVEPGQAPKYIDHEAMVFKCP